MHKLMEYICDELEELERKADKDGKLSMAEVQYADTLLHMKKNLLKADEMYEESEYSEAGGSYAREGRGGNRGGNRGRSNRGSYEGSYEGSYAQRRDARGRYSSERYSRATSDMAEQIRDMMQDAPDDRTRMEFQRFLERLEKM